MFKKVSEHLCLEKETMTIQQHASFDSSAAELNATSKLVKAWESKNAKNAAKAGGVSLMALSLAACGGSSSTTTTSTTTTTTVDAGISLTAASAVLSNSLSTGASAVTTTGADSVSTSLAFLSGSSITGGTGTDTLTLTDAGAVTVGNGTTGGTIATVEALVLADGTNDVDLTATSFTTITGGSGNDTLTLTNLTAGGAVNMGAGNDTVDAATTAILTGTGSTFLGGSGTDTLTLAAAQTVTVAALAAVSGFEALNFGAIGGTSAYTLKGEETSIVVDTTNAGIVVTGTGANLSNLTTITNTDGTNVMSFTASDAGATIDWAGAALTGDIDVITFQNTGANNLIIDGADVSLVAATAVAAGSTDTITIASSSASGADALDATEMAAFENIVLAGDADLDLDVTDGGVAVARTITGDVGDNTIMVNGISAAKTINISSGGTDTVVLAMDASATATITGFTAGTGGDVLNLVNADDSGVDLATGAPIVTTGAAIVDTATDSNNAYILAGSTFQISGALTNVSDAGTVEAAIVAAGFSGTTTDGEFFIVALDNGTDTGVYRVTSNDTAITAASDIDGITLIAVLDGVLADDLVGANII
ncbi:hypothetical protein N9A39_03165 [Planktomarina temperata]|nr:hypothetical protein [Planktomarina temperata]